MLLFVFYLCVKVDVDFMAVILPTLINLYLDLSC